MNALFDEWLKLAEHIGTVCIAQKRVIAGAESCTGGLIAAVLTSVSGSSVWVDRGFVTYSNEAKMQMLGVDSATLQAFGAVSEETARFEKQSCDDGVFSDGRCRAHRWYGDQAHRNGLRWVCHQIRRYVRDKAFPG